MLLAENDVDNDDDGDARRGFIDTNGSSDSAFAPLIILARIGSNYIKPFHQRTHKVTQTFMVLSICSDFDNMLFLAKSKLSEGRFYP